jgi:hypothetical protein
VAGATIRVRRRRELPEAGSRIVDPGQNVYRVIERNRGRLLIEDAAGDRWIVHERRILTGGWTARRR